MSEFTSGDDLELLSNGRVRQIRGITSIGVDRLALIRNDTPSWKARPSAPIIFAWHMLTRHSIAVLTP